MPFYKNKKYLLDCTLRDGGYINDWEFGINNIISIFERLVDANIDFLEIGFIDERRQYDVNRSIFPDTTSIDKTFHNIDKKNTKVVAMIDYGTCDIKYIKDKKDSFIDGIRVIFKKHLRREALTFCEELKKKGYIVFAQLVSTTSYSDDEIKDLADIVNSVEPFAVSIVDTYGLLHRDNLIHYFNILDELLNKKIILGYHAHNNFQMGYANCLSFFQQDTEREILVDGSLHGMGKSAGNAPIELIAMSLNNLYDKKYDIDQILEAIDANVLNFYKSATWGYNMFYFIAALNDCHPNYVRYLMNKKTLSIKSINKILKNISLDKKLMYDKKLIETMYFEYQNNIVDDRKDILELSKILKDREVILLGPANSIYVEKDKIKKYICENKPIVIAINDIFRDINLDYVFISNSKRYSQMSYKIIDKNCKLIFTSNVTPIERDKNSFLLDYVKLIDENTDIIDNSLVMFIKVLIEVKTKKVSLAGFDGYYIDKSNYYDKDKEYDFAKKKSKYLNDYTTNFLKTAREMIEINFITKSIYEGMLYENQS